MLDNISKSMAIKSTIKHRKQNSEIQHSSINTGARVKQHGRVDERGSDFSEPAVAHNSRPNAEKCRPKRVFQYLTHRVCTIHNNTTISNLLIIIIITLTGD